MLCIKFLMPPHLYERVDKWAHERRSTFNYKKWLLLAFTFSTIINFEKTKIYLLSATTTTNPKRTLLYCFRLVSSLIYFLVSLFTILFIVIYFTNTEILCLTTTRWSSRHKKKTLFCRFAKRGKESGSSYFLESSI